MNPIEKKRLETELLRVTAGKAELELTILEREADIERLRANIENQNKRISEIQEKLREQ